MTKEDYEREEEEEGKQIPQGDDHVFCSSHLSASFSLIDFFVTYRILFHWLSMVDK